MKFIKKYCFLVLMVCIAFALNPQTANAQCSSYTTIDTPTNPLITSSSNINNCIDCGPFCGFEPGNLRIGSDSGSSNGYIDITLPIDSDVIRIDVAALSVGPGYNEAIVIYFDGVQIDLNQGSASLSSSDLYISTTANTYSGFVGAIETTSSAGCGIVTVELPCVGNAGNVLRVQNVAVGTTGGAYIRTEICNDAPSQTVNCDGTPSCDSNPYADNCDFDGDGYLNGDDLDDDNDGILDTEECEGTSSTASNLLLNPNVDGVAGCNNTGLQGSSPWIDLSPSSDNWCTGANGHPIYGTWTAPFTNFLGAQSALATLSFSNGSMEIFGQQLVEPLQAGTTYEYSFSVAQEFGGDAEINILGWTGNSSQLGQSLQPREICNPGNGWVRLANNYETIQSNLIDTVRISGTFTPTTSIPFIGFGAGCDLMTYDAYTGYYLYDNFYLAEVGNSICPEDTDNDGITNSFDLDSDGDGCPDAIEGGATFTQTNLDADDSLTGAVDGNGIPIVAGANGQTVGDSQDVGTDLACEPPCKAGNEVPILIIDN